MTADRAFECLLISRDPGVVGVMNPLLENLAIATNVCFSTTTASERLSQGSPDLVIVDCDEGSGDLLRQIEEMKVGHKPMVVAVSPLGDPVPGAHLILRKPVTDESCAESLRFAYSRMLRDHRLHARYPLVAAVIAADQNHRSLAVTVLNIGDGGVGLAAREPLEVGDVLSFRLPLPEANQSIHIEARVQWSHANGKVGCEFMRIPPVELIILHDWLKSRCRIKKPLGEW
jgi:PilZ domain